MYAIDINPDGRVTIGADGRVITGGAEADPTRPCCCNASTCDAYVYATPRCLAIGQGGFGSLYLCIEMMTDQGRTVREALAAGVVWLRINGLCYVVRNLSVLTRDQVDAAQQEWPGAIVDAAAVVELGSSDPGEGVCQECGCCEVVERTLAPCLDAECCECSSEYLFEASVAATIRQVFTAAGLALFYPPPTPRPPGGLQYEADVLIRCSGKVKCVNGIKSWECYSYRFFVRQRNWDQVQGAYVVTEIDRDSCADFVRPPECGSEASGRLSGPSFQEFSAFTALQLIEVGSFLRDRPLDGAGFGPAFLELCTTLGGEVQRQFTVPATIPDRGSYRRHEQQWRNDSSCMAAGCQGLAIERQFDDYENGDGNFRETWNNIVNVSASRIFTETEPCPDGQGVPRCDSARRREARRGLKDVRGLDAGTAVMMFGDTMSMLRAMGR